MNPNASCRIEPDIPFEMRTGETLWSLDYCLAEKIGDKLEIQDLVFNEAFLPKAQRKHYGFPRKTFAVSSEELLLQVGNTYLIQGISIEPFPVDAEGFLDRLTKDQYVSVLS